MTELCIIYTELKMFLSYVHLPSVLKAERTVLFWFCYFMSEKGKFSAYIRYPHSVVLNLFPVLMVIEVDRCEKFAV